MNDAPVMDDDNDVDDVNRNNDEMYENQTENVGNCIQLIDRKTIILLQIRFQNPNRIELLFFVDDDDCNDDPDDDDDDDDTDLDDDSPKLIDCDRVSTLNTGYTCPCRCLGIDSRRQSPNKNEWILANMVVAFCIFFELTSQNLIYTHVWIQYLHTCMYTQLFQVFDQTIHINNDKSVLLSFINKHRLNGIHF